MPAPFFAASCAVQLPRDQGPSLTEIKLNELKHKQQAIQTELLDRGIQVSNPSTYNYK
jgi:hypothetical protein